MSAKIATSPVYLDTSALAKLYVPERWSDDLERALLGRRDLLVSELAVTELTSALARRVRAGELSPAQGRRIYQRLLRDMAEGEFRRLEVTANAHREAERLLFGIGLRVGLRAADALHLGIAVLVGARAIVTFDGQMARAVQEIGTMDLFDVSSFGGY